MPPQFNRKDIFDSNFADVMSHVDKTSGELRLDHKTRKGRALKHWIKRQFDRKITSKDEAEKIEVLRNLYGGVVMSRVEKEEADWYRHFEDMKKYKKEAHTIIVQKKDKSNRTLYAWSNNQKKLKKEGKLLPKREELLVAIGFVFPQPQDSESSHGRKNRFTKQQEEDWNKTYDELVSFKEKHGHCNVAYNDEDNIELARWIPLQRQAYRNNTIDPSRKKRLDDIGFVWFFLCQKCGKCHEKSYPCK